MNGHSVTCTLPDLERAFSISPSDDDSSEDGSPRSAPAAARTWRHPPSPAREWQHPPSFLCPISQQCMHDPVVLSDGHTYERQHIERWLSHSSTSPVTRLELSKRDMYPNHALRNAIEEYFNEVLSVHRRAIRRARRGSRDHTANPPLMRTLDALMQCALLVNADFSVEHILRQIVGEAQKLVGAEVASVFLVDESRQELYSTVNSTDLELRIPLTAGIAGLVATRGEAVIINDAYADARFNKAVDLTTGFKTRNILCAPLRVKKGNVIGVLQLINKTGTGLTLTEELPGPVARIPSGEYSFTSEDSSFLQVFASQAATAVANSGVMRGLIFEGPEETKRSWVPPQPAMASQPSSPVKALQYAPKLLTPTSVARSLSMEAAPAQEVPEARPVKTLMPCKQGRQRLCISEEAMVMLEMSLDSWELDTIRLAELTGNRPLSSLGCFLFERLGLVGSFGLDCQKLESFFLELERGYDDAVHYHNRAHAACVLHLMYAALRSGNLAQKVATALEDGCGGRPGANGALESMACLLAAAAHDYEHPGKNNDFLVKTGHERAVRYNDRHVNENHHASAALELLGRPGLDVLASLPLDDFQRLRELFVDLILATDMADSSSIMQSFDAAVGASAPTATAKSSVEQQALAGDLAGFEPRSPREAVLLLQVALKCADLGHLALSRRVHLRFVQCLEEEFFSQGDQELALGLPVSFLMDRQKPGASKTQVGFMDCVALPVFRSLARACPALQPLLAAAEDNYWYWKSLDTNDRQEEAVGDAEAATASRTPRASDQPRVATDADESAAKSGRRRGERARQRKAWRLAAGRWAPCEPLKRLGGGSDQSRPTQDAL